MNQAGITDTNKNKLIFIGRLPSTITQTSLEAHFIPFGPIVHVSLPLDSITNLPKNHAYIEYEYESDAQAAIENMNDNQISDNVIKVTLASIEQKSRKAVWEQLELQKRLERNEDDSTMKDQE